MNDRTTQSGPSAAASAPTGRSHRWWLIVGGLIALGLLAVAVIWYLGRGTPAAVDTQAAIEAANADEEAAGVAGGRTADADVDADGGTADADTGADATGDPGGATQDDDAEAGATPGELPTEWVVDPGLVEFDFDAGTGTFLGFRIDEELTTVGATTAVGRTPEVEGELRLEDTILEAASITGDLTALTTDISQRDSRAQRAMNTGSFPTSTYELIEPFDLGEVPSEGATLQLEVDGELTLNGVTQPVISAIESVLLDPERLLVTGTFEVLLSDFDLVAPSASIVIGVADTATIEFQLYLSPA